ncbi:MAG: hypothetical protein ACRD4B_09645, partial [Acidobacteriota bacterium]
MKITSDQLPYYPEFAANEFSDNQKAGWNFFHWAIYNTLKKRAWVNKPQGRLPNDLSLLRRLALMENVKQFGKKVEEHCEQAFQDVIALFQKSECTKFLIHPELINHVKEKRSESNEKSNAAKIGRLGEKIAEIEAENPSDSRLKQLREELSQRRARTKEGKKSSASRGLTGGSVSGLEPPKKTIVFNGLEMYPSEVAQTQKDLEAELKAMKDAWSKKSNKSQTELAKYNKKKAQILEKIREAKVARGIIPADSEPVNKISSSVQKSDSTSGQGSGESDSENFPHSRGGENLVSAGEQVSTRMTSARPHHIIFPKPLKEMGLREVNNQ